MFEVKLKMKEERITIENRGSIYAVNKKDIFYLEQEGRKVKVHLLEKVYSFYGKLSESAKVLDGNFFMCHSGCVINMEQVLSIKGQIVHFPGNKCVLLGRENSLRVRQHFKEYVARSF